MNLEKRLGSALLLCVNLGVFSGCSSTRPLDMAEAKANAAANKTGYYLIRTGAGETFAARRMLFRNDSLYFEAKNGTDL
jgi:hypothetical protein